MAKTVKEHTEESDRVVEIVKNANALVLKLQSELGVARLTLEALSDYQHPLHKMNVPYAIKAGRDRDTDTPATVIRLQVGRINALLGDKA